MENKDNLINILWDYYPWKQKKQVIRKLKKIHKSSKAEQIFNFTINQIDEK